ncbi:hypothetical protein DVS28_b0609 (plasmid) [Euzebya pacifica]|uniref:Uncharacterized protein n=1 Tax=Euzebya pacifica TaxID=1608957 RepID=A0A346Y7A2_9ACTN|nr:hypothetical protein [Euzebya pacifica]AXV10349.1 hypothetical protein DVS28_b0609 [Euzebya pacifica]
MGDPNGPVTLVEFADEVPGHLVGAVTTAGGSRLFECGPSESGCRCVADAWQALVDHPAADIACGLVSLSASALLAVDPPPSERSSLPHRLADAVLRGWAGEDRAVQHDLVVSGDGHLRVVSLAVDDGSRLRMVRADSQPQRGAVGDAQPVAIDDGSLLRFVSVDPPPVCAASTLAHVAPIGDGTVCQGCASELLWGVSIDAATSIRVAVGRRTLVAAGDVDGRIGLVAALAATD